MLYNAFQLARHPESAPSRESSAPWAIKRRRLIFVCSFVKSQRILMHFSLLDLEVNATCVNMNFTHLT